MKTLKQISARSKLEGVHHKILYAFHKTIEIEKAVTILRDQIQESKSRLTLILDQIQEIKDEMDNKQ